MRGVLLLLLLASMPAFGQTLDKPRRVSVFVSSEGIGSGAGVSFEYRWSPVWSGELALATEEHTTAVLFQGVFDVRTYPADAVLRYSFGNESSRWRPYAGLGARYVAAPDDVPDFADYSDRVSAQVTGGVEWNATEVWSLRFDAKRLLRQDTAGYDELHKFSVAAGWRF